MVHPRSMECCLHSEVFTRIVLNACLLASFFFLPSKLFKPKKFDTVIDEYTCKYPGFLFGGTIVHFVVDSI